MLKAFEDFHERTGRTNWRIPQDILKSIKNSDLVKCTKGQSDRIVFNIGRNRFRMICGYYFSRNVVFLYIKFVGTHHEYDFIDVCVVDMFKS